MNGEKLRELRQQRVLTLRELAERSGVNLQTIYRAEHGRGGAHPSTIRKLAAALSVDPQELVRTRGRDA